MSEYQPPTENLPIFDVSVFRDNAPYDEFYLSRKGLATSVATETTFTGLVSFNSLTSPPHCAAVPVNPNDLCNKAFVEALAPQTSYIVFLNYSQTFTTSTPTIYKKLNPLTNNTPTTVPFHTVNTTPLLIAGFFNTKADLKFANSIPAGLWNLVLFANCTTGNDQNHIGLNFVLIGITALGVETIIATSAYSPLINVLAPLIGTYSCILSVTNAIDITAYDQIGIKVYALSNTSAGRDGSIFFQYPSYYSSLQTSFATTQAADITVTNNSWSGTNTFNNTTNLNTTIIQGTGSIQFPDTSTQTTAFKSLVSGIYTNSNITVDAQGAISAISTGVGGANAETIDLTLTTSGTGYNIPYSTTTGLASTLLSGGLVYNRDTNTLAVSATNATNLIGGTAGLIPYQSGATTTAFIPVGTTGQVLKSNGTSAPTWTTDIGGNSGSSTSVALTGDDNAGDWFIPFSKTSSATSNALYIDNTTTPLTYNANLGRMSAKDYTIGSKTQTQGSSSGLITYTGAIMDYINQATSGSHRFQVYDSTPNLIVPLTVGSTSISTKVPVNILSTVLTLETPSLTIKDTSSPNRIDFILNPPVQTLNPFVSADNQVIVANGVINTETLTLTTTSSTLSGIRISNNNVAIGVGGTTAVPDSSIAVTPTQIVYFSPTCPIQSGYTVPAGTDNTTKIATTAWVQTAIPLGTSALATNLTNGLIGNVLYQGGSGSTTRMTNGASGTVLTSGGVGAIPTWSANLAGNAGSATAINLSASSGVTHYIPFSSTLTGNSTLQTNSSLNYDGITNTITGNVSGNAGTAGIATNLTAGLIGNVLYQGGAGSTTRMTNGAVGTVLTSGGVGAIPTWSANLAGNAGSATYASNTTVTNDAASATYQALTFTSNITGNLPQKTRAVIATGAGLSYVPSTNLLNVNAAGVGTINTGLLKLQNSTANTSDITNTAGTLNIANNLASSGILLQTANASSVVATRVNITETDTEIVNKLQTSAGIVGPAALLTFTSDMIGYNIKKNGTSGDFNTVSGTIYSLHASGTNGVALVAGVYMVTLYSNFQPPNVVGGGVINFSTTGISTVGTTPYTYVGGTGPISVGGSATLPANANLRVSGGMCTTMVVPTGGGTYYQLVNMAYSTFTTMLCFATASFFHATRIA